MKHELAKLDYSYDALEPHIDAKTMEIHHSKHHNAYVNNLNAALDKEPGLFDVPLDRLLKNLPSVPENIRTAVRNNGGGVYNHNFFWNIMGKGKGGSPKGELANAIDKTFGSFDKFKETFAQAALGRFGSGWVWLSRNSFGNLMVHSTANQDTPISDGLTPIITLDVWEHAYYLKYQNLRPDYVKAWWNVVDWDKAAENFR